jgi:MerR family mercuric resistance operon transcriptional regulator
MGRITDARAPAASQALTIGELATRTSCGRETIRYYERIGLLARPARSTGGHRIYDSAAGRRLAFIRRSRDLGFSLDQVREMLGLVDRGTVDCAEIKETGERQLDHVRRRIADLRRIERTLDDMTRQCGAGRRPSCPIIETLLGPE